MFQSVLVMLELKIHNKHIAPPPTPPSPRNDVALMFMIRNDAAAVSLRP